MAKDTSHNPADGLAALVSDMATDIRRRVVEEPWFGKPLDGPVEDQSKLAGWGAPSDLGKFGPLPMEPNGPNDPNSPFPYAGEPPYWSSWEWNMPTMIEAIQPHIAGNDPLLRLEGPKDEPEHGPDHTISP